MPHTITHLCRCRRSKQFAFQTVMTKTTPGASHRFRKIRYTAFHTNLGRDITIIGMHTQDDRIAGYDLFLQYFPYVPSDTGIHEILQRIHGIGKKYDTDSFICQKVHSAEGLMIFRIHISTAHQKCKVIEMLKIPVKNLLRKRSSSI